jgi:phospholipid/cholesterol/gamma-HCH transport system substrate-binding protein
MERRRDRSPLAGPDNVKIGALVLAAIAIVVYFGFAKDLPFTHDFRLKAAFTSAQSIRPGSPVRIAGVNVGKVAGVERARDGEAALVVMELKDKALPIHRDATAKIRPRIFLEGNFFVDLRPGRPSSPTVDDGHTLPVTQTATPVQFDQVLTALQNDTRVRLQQLLDGYGTALTARPRGAPATAADALNRAAVHSGPALRDAALVAHAALGTEPHDLSGLVAGLGRVTKALAGRERELQGVVSGLNRTTAALAARRVELRAAVRRLGPTVEHAGAALDSLGDALPATRAFAREVLPGIRATPGTIDASFPWIAQVRRLLSATELRGLARELSPATADLATVIDGAVGLLPRARLAARCLTEVVLPTGDIRIAEGDLGTGTENYKEFWHALVGAAGESQNFDGNGSYVRFQTGGGAHTVTFGTPLNRSLANAAAPPLGTRPAFPASRPPYVSSAPCHLQEVPDLNAAPTGRSDGAG